MPTVTGGFLATAIVFVFPALMYQKTVQHLLEDMIEINPKKEWVLQCEVKLAYGLMIGGVVIGLVGATEALK